MMQLMRSDGKSNTLKHVGMHKGRRIDDGYHTVDRIGLVAASLHDNGRAPEIDGAVVSSGDRYIARADRWLLT
jgi:hypothetical protein